MTVNTVLKKVEDVMWGKTVDGVDLYEVLSKQDKEDLVGWVVKINRAFGKNELAKARNELDSILTAIVYQYFDRDTK